MFQPPAQTEIAPAGTADMILTFRNIHDWLPHGNRADYFKAFYRALKPGGILGITDHRADPSQPQDANAKNGYVRLNEGLIVAVGGAIRKLDPSR